MVRDCKPVPSLRRFPSHGAPEFATKFAFGWRTASSAAIYALLSGTALAAEVITASFTSGLRQTPGKKRETKHSSQNQTEEAWQRKHVRLLHGAEAAALIEFAVALPLLVVLVVGIFDFGGAFNLKQELNNAVREGARFASTQPTNDLSTSILKPPSVDAVRFLVDSYLQTAKINDCGLSTVAEPPYGAWPVWVYTATTGCNLTLTINRGQVVSETVGGATVNMLCTTVKITYPYQWHFNSVIQLLVPGANYTFTDLTSDATAVNMN